MYLKPLAAIIGAAVLTAPAFGLAQGPGPLTLPELDGRWVLTIAGDSPESGGPQVTITDASGKPLTRMVIDLEVQARDRRAARCVVTRRGMPSSRKVTPCRLNKGAFIVDIAGSGNDRRGVLSMRLTRNASGAVSGPAVARAAPLPIRFRIGTASLARPS